MIFFLPTFFLFPFEFIGLEELEDSARVTHNLWSRERLVTNAKRARGAMVITEQPTTGGVQSLTDVSSCSFKSDIGPSTCPSDIF